MTQFYHGRPYPSPSTSYFGGTQDNGTIRGTDAGGVDGWAEVYGGDGGYVSFDPTNTNVLFAETTYNNLLRSTNGGSPFTGIFDNGDELSSHFLFIAPLRHDPNEPERLWYGGQYPHRSTNAATGSSVTWVRAGTRRDGSGAISAWAIDPNNSDRVYLGLSDGQMQTTDIATSAVSTTTWPNVSPSWGGSAYVSWIEADPNDLENETVYATNSRFGGGQNHVMRSTNGGTTWTDVTANLPDIAAHCIVVQPGISSNLFVGTDLGIFVSTDTGTSWASMNTPDFSNVVVETMEFQDDSTLYLFTHGRGAWRATVAGVTPGPEITVSPMSIDFGDQEVDAGQTGASSVTITNDGTAPLSITGVSLAGTDLGEFAITSDTGETTLAAAQTRTVQLAFDPTSVGAKSAVLRVTSDDDDEATVDVALSGTGVFREITVSPMSVDFGDQEVDAGQTSASSVTITNDGTTPLSITGVSLAGTDLGEFAITSDTGETTLAAAQTRTVQLAFDPTSVGAKSAVLRVTSDDDDEATVDVDLSGTGVLPEITVSPMSIDFGDQEVDAGQTGASSVTITNDGTASLSITGVSLAGTDLGEFAITSDTGETTLAAAQTRTVELAFDPTSIGAKSAVLRVTSNDGDEGTVDVTLSGTGIVLLPEITVSPTSIGFGEKGVDSGQTGASSVTITNDGTAVLNITGLGLTGTDLGEFAITSDTGETGLNPLETRTVQVVFDPTSLGAKSAALRITSDDGDEGTVDVALSGTGVVTLPSLIYVDVTNKGAKDGTKSNPYNTLQEGIDGVEPGGTIRVASGSYAAAGNTISKNVHLELDGTGVVLIDAAP